MNKIEIRKSTFNKAAFLSKGFENFNNQVKRMIGEIAEKDINLSDVKISNLSSQKLDVLVAVELESDTLQSLSSLRTDYESEESIIYKILACMEMMSESQSSTKTEHVSIEENLPQKSKLASEPSLEANHKSIEKQFISLRPVLVKKDSLNRLKYSNLERLVIDGMQRDFSKKPAWEDALSSFYRMALLSHSPEDISEYTDSILTQDLSEITGEAKLVNPRMQIYSQLYPSHKSVKIMIAIAKKLEIDFTIEAEWKSGFYANRYGAFEYLHKFDLAIEKIDIAKLDSSSLFYSKPKNISVNHSRMDASTSSWKDVFVRVIGEASKRNSADDILKTIDIKTCKSDAFSSGIYLAELGCYAQKINSPKAVENILSLVERFKISIDLDVSWTPKSKLSEREGHLKIVYSVHQVEENPASTSLKTKAESVASSMPNQKEIVQIDDIVLIEWEDKSRVKVKIDSKISSDQPAIKVAGINVVGEHTPLAKEIIGANIGHCGSIGGNGKKFTIVEVITEPSN